MLVQFSLLLCADLGNWTFSDRHISYRQLSYCPAGLDRDRIEAHEKASALGRACNGHACLVWLEICHSEKGRQKIRRGAETHHWFQLLPWRRPRFCRTRWRRRRRVCWPTAPAPSWSLPAWKPGPDAWRSETGFRRSQGEEREWPEVDKRKLRLILGAKRMN